jgi:hypothetical protein
MQAYSQHHAKWGKIENISLKVRNKTTGDILSTSVQHILIIHSQRNKTERRKTQAKHS